MSTGNSLVVTGGGGVLSHTCDSDTEPYARVTVDGTRIPVINEGVRTEVRKDGAMGLTRHSEVYFPREWGGETYTPVVRALDPDEANVYDPVDIELKDHVTDEYHLVHRGFVMGVGGGSHGEKEYRMTVGDVGQLLGAIPFEGTYKSNTHLFKIIGDIIGRVSETITPQIFESVVFETVGDIGNELVVIENKSESAFGQIFQNTLAGKAQSTAANWLFDNQKQFADNKNNCADALQWIGGHLDGIFYFVPHGDNSIKLVFDSNNNDTTLTAQHVETDSGPAYNVRDAIPYEDSENFTVLQIRNVADSKIELTNNNTLTANFQNGNFTDIEIHDNEDRLLVIQTEVRAEKTSTYAETFDDTYSIDTAGVYFSDNLPNGVDYDTITERDTNRRIGVSAAPFFSARNADSSDDVTNLQPLIFIENSLLANPSTVSEQESDQPITIYRNNALHEIRPLNQYIIKGARNNNDSQYPIATATYKPLLRRASMPLTKSEYDDSADTIVAAENKARNKLKDALDETALGTIIAAPSPLADPYTTIVSQPACGIVNRETPPFKYEVESVVHKISASDEDGRRRHETQINASLVIDKENIVVNSEYNQTTEKSESNYKGAWDIATDVFGPLSSPF